MLFHKPLNTAKKIYVILHHLSTIPLKANLVIYEEWITEIVLKETR